MQNDPCLWDYLVKHLQGVEPPKELELCSE